jgi:hypothetical protein
MQKAAAAKDTKKAAKVVVEHNPRFFCYAAIALAALVHLSSVSNIAVGADFRGDPAVAAIVSAFTLLFALLVVALDQFQLFVDTLDYAKACNGRLEGCALVLLMIVWICVVAFITQVDGIGYLTLNIYLSVWFVLVSVIYTLNEWSAAKDILSIQEMTGVSSTLKSWYVLFLSSLVVLGTSINVLLVYTNDIHSADTVMVLAVAIFSAGLSLAWIFVHYDFIQTCNQGGWIELVCSGLSIILWIITTALITRQSGVGATIVGSGCPSQISAASTDVLNCSVVYFLGNGSQITGPCVKPARAEEPGSNLYVAVWLCLGSSIHCAFRWKAQQAIQFAQAQNKRVLEQAHVETEEGDDADLDEFDDASEF